MIQDTLNLKAKHIESEGGSAELEASYRLRHEVYCKEKQFLPDDGTSDKEIDEYDEFSEHFVVLREQGSKSTVVGTVRIVRHSKEKGFPTASHHPLLYERLSETPYHEIGEISRLCIAKDFRRRLTDGLYGLGSYDENAQDRRKNTQDRRENTQDRRENKRDRRRYPIILLHLYREMYLHCKRLGLKYWLATMEDTLLRVLSRFWIGFQPLSEDHIEYYGKVKPYLGNIDEVIGSSASRDPAVHKFFTG